MKKILIFISCFFFMTVASSQEKRPTPRFSPEEYRTRQQQFITDRAGLTEAEAKAFFPLYFELQKAKMDMNRETMHKIRKAHDENISEEEASALVDEMADMKIKCDELEKTYLARFKSLLPATKLLKVTMAENAFQRELLRDMQNGKHKPHSEVNHTQNGQ